MISGGWEFGFAPHWSVKLEYNYIKLGFQGASWNYLHRTPPNP